LLAEGHLDAARKNYEQALALSKKLGDRDGEAAHESDLGNVLIEEGALSDAESHYDRALVLRRRLGLKDVTAESKMLIGGLRNAEGRYAEAAPLAAEAARVFADQRQTGNGAISLANQARAELGLGKIAEARTLCGKARALLTDNRQNGANLPVLLEAVRADTAAGNLEAARRSFAELETTSRKSGWLFYILEARRAGAEIEMLAGRKREGLRQIQSLEEEARARGFGLVEAEAVNLLRGSRPIAH
jgi:tetratricopeptide (TPR) repeat protein